MPTVAFETNIEEDTKNVIDTVSFNLGGRDFIKNMDPAKVSSIREIVEKNSKEEAFDIILKQTSEFYRKNDRFVKLALKQFAEAWGLIENDVFKRLTKITKKPICSQKFTAAVTTMYRCPYNSEKFWFMVSLFNSPLKVNTTIVHEILHIQIINSYKDKIQKMPEKSAWNLLESLTFLLNEEFSDLLTVPDSGYPLHQELRAKLLEEWRKDKDFEKFLPKAIKIASAVKEG